MRFPSLLTLSVLFLGATALPLNDADADADALDAEIHELLKRETAEKSNCQFKSRHGPGPKPPLPPLPPTPPVTCDDFWLARIDHEGVAPYAPTAGYQVWRNVKDFGAVGDGIADDTAAINEAISSQGRCGPGCTGSTITPGLIYFPPGTYRVTAPIIDFYYTQLIGNPGCPPVIKADFNFVGRWVLDTNPYQDGGVLAWGATNVFWRQVAHFVFDLTDVAFDTEIAAIHWPSSQATSLSNVEFRLSEAPGTRHQGLFIEEGSGGYIGDLVFYGGNQAMIVGNQQFTFKNIAIYNARTAIEHFWSWGWTYVGISITNCSTGWDLTSNNGTFVNVGTITIIDSSITDTPIGIAYAWPNPNQPNVGNTLILENLDLENVPVAVRGPFGTVLPGTTSTTTSLTIPAWGRGNSYDENSGPVFFQGTFTPPTRPSALTAPGGRYFTASKPYYEDQPLSAFLTAREFGAKGDGSTDDTRALNRLFEAAAKRKKIAYINAGMYRVTRTVFIPPGSRIFGDSSFPVILSSGRYFENPTRPQPVVQVGNRRGPGSEGRIQWSNTIVSTRGKQPGAILIEYNLATTHAGQYSGMWDVHTRIGGFAGSDLQLTQCPKTPETPITSANLDVDCVAAFMSMHITRNAANLYQENNWIWVADHDIEEPANNQQITVYAGRGLLVEDTRGPLWLVASSVEHHQLYEYQFYKASTIFAGQVQTETAYYQPNPDARLPFAPDARYHDPELLTPGDSGWGVRAVDTTDLFIYGAGLYSFFDNYDLNCSQVGTGTRCQQRILSLERSRATIYNLNTVGTENMVTIDGLDQASYLDNLNGFISSVALVETRDLVV
ncbi:hypothetical protein QC761_404880 [Podospora bellae-mahoneyi]|uniref:Rhamnogalacturonase A/B/Epimerase-like pectate lyase domain-containing protein n=1 Tax=Podospora bellae-mahoneyi TaxID=2093777 RepID=A0ABR0FL17_9PEZI|nr:hypothetical protein QC761_404880 [Podospora bellae-mahoneyi]